VEIKSILNEKGNGNLRRIFLEQITDEVYPLLKPKELQINLNVSPQFRIYGDGTGRNPWDSCFVNFNGIYFS